MRGSRPDLTGSAVSHQLRQLRDRRIVDFERDGTTLQYRLTDEHIARFCREALYHADHVASGKEHQARRRSSPLRVA